jgi:N-acetyltransferase
MENENPSTRTSPPGPPELAAMRIVPVTLEGEHVRLDALAPNHEEPLNRAAADGALWSSRVTTVPRPAAMAAYIATAVAAQAGGTELPFVVVRKSSGDVVGCTRFYGIERTHRRLDIGYTWLAASAQRTPVNTEAKLLLLTHAFEVWRCIRVGLVTHVRNQQSRRAIERIGAKEEGVLRNHMVLPDGSYRDSVFFSVIAAEWPVVKAGLIAKLRGTG